MAIYVLKHGPLYKIGYTEDWLRRYRTFQRQNQFSGDLSAVLVTSNELGRSAESALHSQFASYRLPGTEWFRGEGDLTFCFEQMASWRDELWVAYNSDGIDLELAYLMASDDAANRLYKTLSGNELPKVSKPVGRQVLAQAKMKPWVEPTDEFLQSCQDRCDHLIEVIEELKADIGKPQLDRQEYCALQERIGDLCREINYGLHRDWTMADWEGSMN